MLNNRFVFVISTFVHHGLVQSPIHTKYLVLSVIWVHMRIPLNRVPRHLVITINHHTIQITPHCVSQNQLPVLKMVEISNHYTALHSVELEVQMRELQRMERSLKQLKPFQPTAVSTFKICICHLQEAQWNAYSPWNSRTQYYKNTIQSKKKKKNIKRPIKWLMEDMCMCYIVQKCVRRLKSVPPHIYPTEEHSGGRQK